MRYFVFVTLLLLPAVSSAQPLPSEVCATLHATRPTSFTPSDLANWLNRVAWIHRNEGWGVSVKKSGNFCPRRDGLTMACDILHRRSDNFIWDVLVAAGDPGGSLVTCGDALGQMTDPTRPWAAPISDEGPPDTPPPPSSDSVLVAIDQLKTMVELISSNVDLTKLDQAAAESYNAAVRALEIEALLQEVQRSLEEHRAEVRKVKSWASDWRNWLAVISSIVAGLGIGVAAK